MFLKSKALFFRTLSFVSVVLLLQSAFYPYPYGNPVRDAVAIALYVVLNLFITLFFYYRAEQVEEELTVPRSVRDPLFIRDSV